MRKLPRITIVTPSYNQARYLEATLKSVLDQAYPNLEYIVMDGGSTDGSVDILRKYADRLAYWESESDNGQADAIYRGFERATGEILGWLNSDDLLLPGALTKVARWLSDHPHSDMVIGGSVLIDSSGEPLRDRLGLPRCNLGTRVTLGKLLYWGCGFNQPASFWRRDAFFATGGFDTTLRFCFDYDMCLRFARHRRIGRIREFLACFRVHEASKTSTLQNVMEAENRLLRSKYVVTEQHVGSRIKHHYYVQQQYLQARILQLLMLLGLVRIPAL